MKNFTLLLLFLFSTTSFAATAQVNNVIQMGGVGVSNVSISGGNPPLIIPEPNSQGFFALYAHMQNSSGNYTAFYKNGVAYQVTAGKKFVVYAVMHFTGSGAEKMQLVTATAAISGNAASLTGGVYQGGGAANYVYITPSSSAAWTTYPGGMYEFAASTYPGVQMSTAGDAVWVIGKEI